MDKARGIILRVTPYSDTSRIVTCFTEQHGSLSLFQRFKSKRPGLGIVQTGAFVSCVLSDSGKGMSIIKEVSWDHDVPTTPLDKSRLAAWVFTIELACKSVPERFPIRPLYAGLYNYYLEMLQLNVSDHPLTPLLLMSKWMGVIDLYHAGLDPSESYFDDLCKMGELGPDAALRGNPVDFDTVLDSYMQAFSMRKVESLALLQ
jgi:Recombination protein O N terminal